MTSSARNDGVRIKVLLSDVGSSSSVVGPLIIELVGYDTVKTLKGVLENCVQFEGDDGDNASTQGPRLDLFSVYPRKRLDDDSKTLAEVGLSPNGVLHLRTWHEHGDDPDLTESIDQD